jgi:hypothetical protein
VVVSASLNVVVHGGENTSVSVGPNGGFIHADTPTLKSKEVQNGGFESEKRFYLRGCEEPPIYRSG